MMVKLQLASVMANVSNEARDKFERKTLDSESFKSLVAGIESSAEDGSHSYTYVIGGNDDPRILDVFTNQLKNAGYEVSNSLRAPGIAIVIKW